MLDADRPGTQEGSSPEVATFVALRDHVRAAVAEVTPNPPPFDLMWSGVEARLASASRERAEASARPQTSLWRAMLGQRPLWVLAPAGALVMAAVLGYFVLAGGSTDVDNRCYVDSFDASSGTILVEQDMDDRMGATVIWHLSEG